MSLDGRHAHTCTGPLHILVVNHDVPPRDRDSGSLRLFRLLELLVSEGHSITLVGMAGAGQERATAELVALGIDVFPVDCERLRDRGISAQGPTVDFPKLLAERRFDLALLSHFDVAEQYLPLIRAHSPLTQVVIDTVDVHHVRERRGAELTGDPVALAAAEQTRVREQAIYGSADALVAVSDDDAAALMALAPEVPRFVVSNVHAPAAETPGFDARRGLVFVGNFRHTPNIDAALEFHRQTWPLIKAGLPGARLTVVGTAPPPEVLRLDGDDVEVTGWVADVAPYLDAARVSIAPLRYGGGVKGKIGEALGRGLPVVTTTVGAEGMELGSGETALVADEPAAFADAVLRLHGDRDLWERVSIAGRAHVDERLGPDAALHALRALVGRVVRTPFVLAAAAPEVAEAIGAYASAFSPEDPVSLVLTVPADDPAAPQAAFDAAARTLAERGISPDDVADIQILPASSEPVLPARTVPVSGEMRWSELAATASVRSRRRATPRAAVLLHALDDHAAVSAQIRALERAGLPDDVELVVAADAPGPEMESLLATLGHARVIRAGVPLGRYQAWQAAAHATQAPLVVGLAPLALPTAGFVDPLLDAIRGGAALAAPVVDGAAGLRVAPDGSLWPRGLGATGAPDALPLDCIAATRELIAEGLPACPVGDGHAEAQLAAWARDRGGLGLAHAARVERIPAPAASVIIATRNRSEELPDCIELLLSSGVQDAVIVDNASTDDTAAIAAELAERSGGIVRVVYEPRGGLCHARNAGAAAARHDLLLYIDDDARPAPGWLNRIAWVLARPGVANAGGAICGLWPESRPAGWPGRELEGYLSILDHGQAERTIVPPEVVYGANWAVRRSALDAVGGFDPGFGWGPESRIGGEETLVAWRLHQAGIGASVYAPEAAVGHRISPGRIDDWYMIQRALSSGIEWPRIKHALGDAHRDDLISWVGSAAGRLLSVIPLQGQMTVRDALEQIASAPAPLVERVPVASILGELASSVALLGEEELIVGALRLQVEPATLLRGFLPGAVEAARAA
jgi:glycosyltransferase involved in cell wall biosynthesis